MINILIFDSFFISGSQCPTSVSCKILRSPHPVSSETCHGKLWSCTEHNKMGSVFLLFKTEFLIEKEGGSVHKWKLKSTALKIFVHPPSFPVFHNGQRMNLTLSWVRSFIGLCNKISHYYRTEVQRALDFSCSATGRASQARGRVTPTPSSGTSTDYSIMTNS